jgi:hypothetical protein
MIDRLPEADGDPEFDEAAAREIAYALLVAVLNVTLGAAFGLVGLVLLLRG